MRTTFCLFILFFLSFSMSALALPEHFKPIQLDDGFNVTETTTVSIDIGEIVFLKNLLIQAQGLDMDSTIEVMVNGEIKGTIYAPGKDPSYIVTIAEETSSVEFRHRSGGTMQVLDILAMAGEASSKSIGFNIDQAEGVINLAKTVIEISNTLHSYTSLVDESIYLLPIKKKAGLVLIMSQAHGELSIKTRKALWDMARSVYYAKPYLDKLLEKPALFDHAVDILIVRETIQELLD